MQTSNKQIIAHRLIPQKSTEETSASPATGSQFHYKVDSAKYLKYAKQTHFAVSDYCYLRCVDSCLRRNDRSGRIAVGADPRVSPRTYKKGRP